MKSQVELASCREERYSTLKESTCLMANIIRELIIRVLTLVLFYSRALKLVDTFVTSYSGKRDADGKLRFPFVTKRRSRILQVLIYHRVNDECDNFFPGVPTALFNSQMEYLATNCNVLPLNEAISRLRGDDLPDRAVVITFDDGYRDNFDKAFPILKKLCLPASIFLATDVVGCEKVLWHDRIFSAFRETKVPWLTGIAGQRRRLSLRTIDEKVAAQREVTKVLFALEDRDRLFWVDYVVRELEIDDFKEKPRLMLSWDEIKTMQQHNISFGSHTLSHPILSRMSLERSRIEIECSKETIEKHLNVAVTTFAYPVGRRQDFNDDIKRVLRESGYVCALTTIPGTNDGSVDPYELKRATPWETYLPAFAAKLSWYRFC
jgi:peptidoglycan/xylan/chitin deacetylase (PgdA/CDA1 family)